MPDTSLYEFLVDRLSWELCSCEDVNIHGLADDLAYSLKSRGYCADPYLKYEKAFNCQINKRREKECLMTSCASYHFCNLLRKEGYIG